ncbi:peptidoglycan-binding domain-containing protein [Sphaerisporangium album]|uniref:peptidoglycan-binding domain-containing protein n=1 Tax=Sphaerisporangium album TaxID=509200 RepID=UPI001FE53422|nr:peptidoglycan-binding domain-containing protein [Sphaerisporangium album]
MRVWQAQMKRRGWAIDVDGAYGAASRAVCMAFQKEKGLDADGVVGRDTWRAAFALPVT